MNNNTFWNSTATTRDGSNYNNITFTASTGDNITFSASNCGSVWFPYYEESTWLPYDETKYKPEWHIKVGYKNQMKSMWN